MSLEQSQTCHFASEVLFQFQLRLRQHGYYCTCAMYTRSIRRLCEALLQVVSNVSSKQPGFCICAKLALKAMTMHHLYVHSIITHAPFQYATYVPSETWLDLIIEISELYSTENTNFLINYRT